MRAEGWTNVRALLRTRGGVRPFLLRARFGMPAWRPQRMDGFAGAPVEIGETGG